MSQKVRKIFNFFSILAGGRFPPDPPVFGWVAKAPPDLPPKRSSAAFDRGDQTGPPLSNAFFFGAADDTSAADDTGAANDRPTTITTFFLTNLLGIASNRL